ncbi:MAG: oligosaccharide flippase family protein [Candidatus Peribacteraceae bacterium]|nr:oligosaccharide flippase family protein [Candidatus Peribacteraceae bacterium]
MSSRKIATSTLWQLASQVAMAALSILAVKFVALGLSKELAGIYNSSYGFLQLFGILADFGLYAVAVKEVSRSDRKEEVLGAIIILRCIALAISLSAALLFVWFVPVWKGTPLPLSVTIASLVPFFTLLAGIIRTVFQINYKMHFVFIAEVSQRVLAVFLIGLFILFGVRGSHDLQHLHMFLYIGGIGAFLLFFLSLTYGNRLMTIRPHWDSALLKKYIKSAAPFGIAFLCMALYREFDITLIALLRDDFELQNAYYGFVTRIMGMGFLIPTFLLNSTLPILSERDLKGEDTRSLLGKTFLIILIFGSIILLFSALWSRPIIQLLTTEAYLSTPARPGADTALRLMSIPMFLNGIILFGFYSLLTKNSWKKLVLALLLGVVISLVMNLILITKTGFVGAAQTSITVHSILAIILLFTGAKAMPFRLSQAEICKWIVFTVLLGGGLWIVRPLLTGEIETIIGLGVMSVYMLILMFTLGFNKLIK